LAKRNALSSDDKESISWCRNWYSSDREFSISGLVESRDCDSHMLSFDALFPGPPKLISCGQSGFVKEQSKDG
jgi:hypothetical protein